MTYNIPTILTNLFPALCKAIERGLHAKPLPQGASGAGDPEGNKPICAHVTIGKHTLELQRTALALLAELSYRERIHFFEMLPKILISCFVLARRDYLRDLNLGLGHFALVHITHGKPDTLRRLAKACDLDPDKPKHTARVELGIRILRLMNLKIGDHTSIEGLLSSAGILKLKHNQIDEGAHRGGLWHIEALHPALCDLMLTRFAQLEERALELKGRTFNLWSAILGHRFLVQGSRGKPIKELQLDVNRLIRDAALSQTTRRGSAREYAYMLRGLRELQDSGLLRSWCLSEDHQKVRLKFQPPTLAHNRFSTSNLVTPDPPEPPTLAHLPSQTLIDGQESKDSEAPVRTLRKSSSSLAPPSGRGAKRGKAQKRKKRKRKGVRTRKK